MEKKEYGKGTAYTLPWSVPFSFCLFVLHWTLLLCSGEAVLSCVWFVCVSLLWYHARAQESCLPDNFQRHEKDGRMRVPPREGEDPKNKKAFVLFENGLFVIPYSRLNGFGRQGKAGPGCFFILPYRRNVLSI